MRPTQDDAKVELAVGLQMAACTHAQSFSQPSGVMWPMADVVNLETSLQAHCWCSFSLSCCMSSSRNTLNHNFAASNSLIFTAKINKYVFAEYNTHMIIICFLNYLCINGEKRQKTVSSLLKSHV